MKDIVRTFIAIDLSPEIYRRLDEVTGQLKTRLPSAPVRWVTTHNIHLTLKFLGEVSIESLDAIKDVVQRHAGQFSPFEFQVGKLGVFPSIRRPRVIWVGVDAPQELGMLQRGIENDLNRLGYPREERGFSPHLTLGRVGRENDPTDARQIADVLEHYAPGILGVTQVNYVRLYRSDLKPGGSVYTPLFTASLRS